MDVALAYDLGRKLQRDDSLGEERNQVFFSLEFKGLRDCHYQGL